VSRAVTLEMCCPLPASVDISNTAVIRGSRIVFNISRQDIIWTKIHSKISAFCTLQSFAGFPEDYPEQKAAIQQIK